MAERDSDQSADRDFIQQSGGGNMPVHTGSGDIHVYLTPPSRRGTVPGPPPGTGPVPPPPGGHPPYGRGPVPPPPAGPPPHFMGPQWNARPPGGPYPMPYRPMLRNRRQNLKAILRWFRAKRRWYYVVAVFSSGVFAWVPFLLEERRLRHNRARMFLAIFVAMAVALVILTALEPPSSGSTRPASTLSTIATLAKLSTMVCACVFVRSLRDEPTPVGAPNKSTLCSDTGTPNAARPVPPAPTTQPAPPIPTTAPANRGRGTSVGRWLLRVALWLVGAFFFALTIGTVGMSVEGEWETTSEAVMANLCFDIPFIAIVVGIVWDVRQWHRQLIALASRPDGKT